MNETTDKVPAATINVASNEEVTPTEAVEEWRTIVGYEEYEASSLGRIRDSVTKEAVTTTIKRGKLYVSVYKARPTGDPRKQVAVLVASAFIANPDKCVRVRHLDGNVENNAVSNLEWYMPTSVSVSLPPEVVWVDVPGFDSVYAISNTGLVRNNKTDKILRPSKSKAGGYWHVCLFKSVGNKVMRVYESVHRLVAEAFLVCPDPTYQVDHIDGNRDNNCVNNLRWVKAKENSNNPVTLQKLRDKIKEIYSDPGLVARIKSFIHTTEYSLHKKGREIICLSTKERWPSIAAAARENHVSINLIRKSCLRVSAGIQRLTSYEERTGRRYAFADAVNI